MAKKLNDDELISTGKRRKRVKEVPTNGVRVDLSVKERPQNRYYFSVAGKYRIMKYLSIVMLFAFLLVMLLFFRENITYSNLMYLIRDLDVKGESGESAGEYSNITYDGSAADEFVLFKGRVMVAGTSGLTVYDASGSEETEYDSNYAEPKMETGNKYLIMYDCGAYDYSVYNSVARVLTSKTDNIIEGAAMSDSGYYALLTRSEESKYLITVYNSGFKPVTKYYKEKYVTDLAIDPDGKNLAAVSVSQNTSSVSCEVTFAEIGTEEMTSLEYPGLMPVAAYYASDGTLFVMCDTAILGFFGGELKWRHDFAGSTPNSFCIEGDTAVVATSKNSIGSSNDISVFDTEGNILYNITLERKISCVSTDGKYAVYAVGDSVGTRISLADGTLSEESIAVIPEKLLAPDGSLIVCGESGTDSYFYGE